MDIFPKDLRLRAQTASQKYPDLKALFLDIATHIRNLNNESSGQQAPASKKRKLEPDDSTTDDSQLDSVAEISFSIPQRKKLKLELGRNAERGTIRGTNPSTSEADFWLRWKDIQFCICVPVPEKPQTQYNFCVIPQSSNEQMLFTVPGTKIKPELVSTDTKVDPEETYKSLCIKLLNRRLGTKVMEPDEREFVSQVPQAQRKGEKAVHIKAFLGSKDGMFPFLSSCFYIYLPRYPPYQAPVTTSRPRNSLNPFASLSYDHH